MGIKDSEIDYHFDNNGKMDQILIDFGKLTQTSKQAGETVKTIEKLFKEKYGTPIPANHQYPDLKWVGKANADSAIEYYKSYGGTGKSIYEKYWIYNAGTTNILIDIIQYSVLAVGSTKDKTTYHVCAGFMPLNGKLPEPKIVKATEKPKPTAVPLHAKLLISSVKIGRNSIGTTRLYVRFKNNTGYNIDRIDFNVICYDAYGNLVKGYNYYDSTDCYDDGILKKGATSGSNYYWDLYGFDGTKSVKIAITRFHLTNGKTVNIPVSEQVYRKYK